jgi:hypothetical protein
MYGSTLSLTSRIDGVDGQRHVPAALTRVRDPLPTIQEAGCGKYHPHRDSIPGPSSPQRVGLPSGLSKSYKALFYRTEIVRLYQFHGQELGRFFKNKFFRNSKHVKFGQCFLDFRQEPFYVPPPGYMKSIKTYAQVYQLQLYLLFYADGETRYVTVSEGGRSIGRSLLWNKQLW